MSASPSPILSSLQRLVDKLSNFFIGHRFFWPFRTLTPGGRQTSITRGGGTLARSEKDQRPGVLRCFRVLPHGSYRLGINPLTVYELDS